MKDRWWWPLAEALFYFVFAGFAGAIGYALRQLNSNLPVLWKRVWLEAAGAAFVGFLVYQLCLALDLSREWTGVVVGVCGWLGSSATISMLEPIIHRVLGANHNADKQT